MRYSLLIVVLLLVGCGEQQGAFSSYDSAAEAPQTAESTTRSAEPSEVTKTDNRKMVYKASLHLVVEDFSKTRQAVAAEVKRANGNIENHSVDRSYGDRVSGDWILRVPVESFESTLEALRNLGVPEFEQINAEDNTAEHVDLTARIKSQKMLEERLLKLLEERTDDLKTVIEVETKLSTVRQSIEQLEGYLRTLDQQIALTTITLKAREEKNYTPPQAPTFAAQIAATFSESIDVLTALGKALVLGVVALSPWLAIALLFALPLVVWRLLRRPRNAN